MCFRALVLTSLISIIAISNPAFAQSISGSIRDSGDNPLGGAAGLFDASGHMHGEFWTDHIGNFQTHPLANGTYFIVTMNTIDMLDKAWDDIPCDNLSCDITASTPIEISGTDRSGIDFVLEPILSGGRISGHVQDDSNTPVPALTMIVRNSKGEQIFAIPTDPSGDYETILFSDDSYFVHTASEPWGLGREMYNNIPCDPADACFDPAYVATHATAVVVDGVDKPDIDFNLEIPVGGMISGQITDADLGIPLAEVHLDLLNESGDYLANTDTDVLGNYHFSSLDDGDYKVITIGVPPGYTVELFDGDHCPNASCDLKTTGDIITVSGGALADGKNIALDYEGTRIFGTVTRSDSGAPVGSLYAHMGVDLFSESGDYLGFWNANRAGQFQIEPPGAGKYYLATSLDMDYHGLIHEAWDDVKCIEDCHPPAIGANLITVLDGNTFVANFELDPGFNISGTIQFEGAATDSGYVNIWDAGGYYVASAGNGGGGNWKTPLLAPGTYYATARGEDFGMVSQLYNGLSCPQEFCDVTSGTEIVLSDTNETGVDFNLEAISADWTISGTVLDNNSNPLGGAVRLFDPMGNYLGEFWLDEFGNYQTDLVANGTYFVITIHTGDMLDEAWDNIPCENMTCDIPASTPIIIDGANRTGIDFALDPIVQGGRIYGHVGDGSDSPLPAVMVVVKNHKGEHIFETFTDPGGNYQSDLLANDSYFVHTVNEPTGMGRELYDDVPCLPSGLCDDPAFITSQGTAVVIDGTDETGIDFILEVPAGGQISGRVGDADIGIPLPDVHMNLLNEFGNQLTYTNTDALGNYYFAGLEDGNYKVIAIGVPPRYSSELYGGEHCNNWECDLNTAGTVIPINGGAVSTGRDIELDYVGTRLLIKVTRSDTGEPVSSLYAYAGIDLFNSAGEYMLGRGTNSAGQVQFHPRNPNDFYLVFINDWNFHGLLNEAWKDIRCFDNCSPLDIGATKITALEGATVVVDFIVDPEVAFKDGFE